MLTKAAPQTQSDLFEPERQPTEYQVIYCPPDYPDKCFPSRCTHGSQFVMCANVELVPAKRGGRIIEIDHSVCLACGMTQPCTIGGNILVDLQMLFEGPGQRHWKIGLRLIRLRDKWARLATYLFDENGWNGRHEKIARQIDPHLTMKLSLEPIKGGCGIRMGKIKFDPCYLRWDDEAE